MDDPKAKPKNNYPLEEIQRNDFGKKPDIKLVSKMNQDKKVLYYKLLFNLFLN